MTSSSVDRATQTVTRTTTFAEGTWMQDVTINGLLHSSRTKTGLTTTYGYDGLGRQTSATDARNNISQTHYDATTGQVDYTTDGAGYQTHYAYYPPSPETGTGVNAGRLKSITAPNSKAQYFDYDYRGRQVHTWGDVPYPLEYVYDDDSGRLTELHTYRSGNGWNSGDAWPGGSAAPDVTKWTFDPPTGLLVEKDYGYGGSTTDSTYYDYTPEGKPASRTTGRGGTTYYHYYGDGSGQPGEPITGELRQVEYPPASPPEYPVDTPNVTFTYDRLGRRHTVEDAVGMRTFAYRDDSDLQLNTETVAGSGGFYSKTITRSYDEYGRTSGFSIDSDYTVGYAYEASTGRLNKVTGPGLPATDGVAYERLKDTGGTVVSELIGTVNFVSSPQTGSTRTYEANRDVLLTVVNKCSGNTISSYNYTMDTSGHGADAIGRRTKVSYGGSAFPQSQYNLVTTWAYNDRNEVTDSRWYYELSVEIPTWRRQYAYDPIGNRLNCTVGTGSPLFYYTRNALNQYTDIVDSTQPPPATEYFSYDGDGNMIQDGTCNYTWDAENRPCSVTPQSPVNGNKRAAYAYDYLGRRAEKKVWTYTNGAWPQDPNSIERYVYDGWNVVLTLGGAGNTIVRKSTWGLDLSGTLQGAGGIGGLLANKEGSSAYWYFYDGNGNVTQVLSPPSGVSVQSSLTDGEVDSAPADDGSMDAMGALGVQPPPPSGCTLQAHYEYDPYGNVLYSTGTYATVNPFRFSTKWFDPESGMYSYPRRYYIPRLGRWGSWDPIGEEGGPNLYSFTANDPIDHVDPVGENLLGFLKGLVGCDILHNDCLAMTGNTAGCDQAYRACKANLGPNHHHCFDGVTGTWNLLFFRIPWRFCACTDINPLVILTRAGCPNNCVAPKWCAGVR